MRSLLAIREFSDFGPGSKHVRVLSGDTSGVVTIWKVKKVTPPFFSFHWHFPPKMFQINKFKFWLLIGVNHRSVAERFLDLATSKLDERGNISNITLTRVTISTALSRYTAMDTPCATIATSPQDLTLLI